MIGLGSDKTRKGWIRRRGLARARRRRRRRGWGGGGGEGGGYPDPAWLMFQSAEEIIHATGSSQICQSFPTNFNQRIPRQFNSHICLPQKGGFGHCWLSLFSNKSMSEVGNRWMNEWMSSLIEMTLTKAMIWSKSFHKSITAVSNPIFLAKLSTRCFGKSTLGKMQHFNIRSRHICHEKGCNRLVVKSVHCNWGYQ